MNRSLSGGFFIVAVLSLTYSKANLFNLYVIARFKRIHSIDQAGFLKGMEIWNSDLRFLNQIILQQKASHCTHKKWG